MSQRRLDSHSSPSSSPRLHLQPPSGAVYSATIETHFKVRCHDIVLYILDLTVQHTDTKKDKNLLGHTSHHISVHGGKSK